MMEPISPVQIHHRTIHTTRTARGMTTSPVHTIHATTRAGTTTTTTTGFDPPTLRRRGSRPDEPLARLASASPLASPSASTTPRCERFRRLCACGSRISGIRTSRGPSRPPPRRASPPRCSPRSLTPWSERAKETTAAADWQTTRASSRSRRRGVTGRLWRDTTSTTRAWSWWFDFPRRTRSARRSWTARSGWAYRRLDCASGC
mmetsp:Transcript_12118/g.47066  ORF Transcript_12118/g.47066 Transcript_12118/m.47066 type:complete len:204 (+) Transcript_12118:163-774(+)